MVDDSRLNALKTEVSLLKLIIAPALLAVFSPMVDAFKLRATTPQASIMLLAEVFPFKTILL